MLNSLESNRPINSSATIQAMLEEMEQQCQTSSTSGQGLDVPRWPDCVCHGQGQDAKVRARGILQILHRNGQGTALPGVNTGRGVHGNRL